MNAVVQHQYGPPDVLTVTNVEQPIPGDREVLIRVIAATVNRTDCAILRAQPFIMRFVTGCFAPKNKIPGTTFAGTVESVGEKVTAYTPGDHVFGFDDNGLRSFAEYLTLSEDRSFMKIPANATHAEAVAVIEGVHYAYNFINKVTIAPGIKVLVNGASGAIGSAAVQLLKHFGAAVVAVCTAKTKDLILSLGAERVIDYQNEDFTHDNEQYDVIFDAVGKSRFGTCKHLLKPDGVYLSSELGPKSENIFLALMTPLAGGKKVIFPIPTNIKASLTLTKELMEKGALTAVIDRTYPLSKIADAFRFVESGEKSGNVVITVTS